MFGLHDPLGFAEVGYILLPHGRGQCYATRAGTPARTVGVRRPGDRTAAGEDRRQRRITTASSSARVPVRRGRALGACAAGERRAHRLRDLVTIALARRADAAAAYMLGIGMPPPPGAGPSVVQGLSPTCVL